ncbi:MAG: DUF962 domain-containing protein [Myxococcaceae bacterium]
MRTADAWFTSYGSDHQHPTNRTLHWLCVPAILWASIAALWTIPVPAALGAPWLWAAMAMALALLFYFRLSARVGLAMLVLFALLSALTRALYGSLGPSRLLALAAAVFVLAWVGQFIGHHYEGKRPSFLTDLSYLLVGPAWLVSKVLRRAGWAA